jgi:hypothetical protein
MSLDKLNMNGCYVILPIIVLMAGCLFYAAGNAIQTRKAQVALFKNHHTKDIYVQAIVGKHKLEQIKATRQRNWDSWKYNIHFETSWLADMVMQTADFKGRNIPIYVSICTDIPASHNNPKTHQLSTYENIIWWQHIGEFFIALRFPPDFPRHIECQQAYIHQEPCGL